jgi:hypothetical protein
VDHHGCVHLSSEFARLLFEISLSGMTVVIADTKSEPTWDEGSTFSNLCKDRKAFKIRKFSHGSEFGNLKFPRFIFLIPISVHRIRLGPGEKRAFPFLEVAIQEGDTPP